MSISTSNDLVRLNEAGVVITVKTSMFGNTVQLGSDALSERARGRQVQAKAHKIDSDFIRPIQSVANKARKAVTDRSLRFMSSAMSGAYWTANENIPSIESAFLEQSSHFDARVSEFINNWDRILEEAQTRLGDFYDYRNYPRQTELARHFRLTMTKFHWTPTPDTASDQIHDMVAEFKAEATAHLRTSFGDLISHVVERLGNEADPRTGELRPKTFKNSLVDNLVNFLNNAEHLNIGNDEDLRREMARVRELMEGREVTAQALRTDGELRSVIQANFREVQERFEDGIILAPRRRMRRGLPVDPDGESELAATHADAADANAA